MLQVNPKMLPRLAEIEKGLILRRKHAEEEQWLGEVEGIDLTLTFVRTKQADAARLAHGHPSRSVSRPPAARPSEPSRSDVLKPADQPPVGPVPQRQRPSQALVTCFILQVRTTLVPATSCRRERSVQPTRCET